MRKPTARAPRAISDELHAELATFGVDAEAFALWLGHQLELLTLERAAAAPPRQAEADRLHQAVAALRQAERALALTPRTAAGASAAALRAGVSWPALRARLRADATAAAGILGRAADELAQVPAKRGRRPVGARDALLAAIVERLRTEGVKAGTAHALALRVLQTVGVAAPAPEQADPERASRRAVSRARKP